MKKKEKTMKKIVKNSKPKTVNFPTLLEAIEKVAMDYVASKGIKNGQALWPLRTAVSGKQMTPAGAYEIMEVLGKEESLSRIKAGIEKLASLP